MGEIYAEATRVLVWFGRSHPSWPYVEAAANQVLAFLETKGESWFLSRTAYDVDLAGISEYPFPKVVAEVLKFIADVRWFSRLWVVQEIALAKDGQAQCGQISVEWKKIAALVKLFTNMAWFTEMYTQHLDELWSPAELANGIVPTAFHNINLMTVIITKGNAWIEEGNWYNSPRAGQDSFVHRLDGFFGTRSEEQALAAWTSYLLHAGAWFSCTVAEDYYYSSVGIAARLCESEHVLVEPNVGGPLIELYTQLAAKILSTSRTVAFLAVNGDLARKSHDGIPSWVPDLTSKIEKPNPMSFNDLYLPGMFDASKLTERDPAPRSIDVANGTLILVGACFDKISSVTSYIADELMNQDDAACIAELLEYLFSLPPNNSKGQSRVEILWRTLIFDCEVYFKNFERVYKYPARDHCALDFRSWLLTKLALLITLSPNNDTRARVTNDLDKLARDGAAPDAIPAIAEVERYVRADPEDSDWREKITSGAREIRRMAGRLVTQRRLFVTKRYCVAGMGSLSLQPDDEVWMIRDSAAPLILRPVEPQDGNKMVYKLVGETYIHGHMNGEMLEEGYGLNEKAVVLI
jgi:hypothetical protein